MSAAFNPSETFNFEAGDDRIWADCRLTGLDRSTKEAAIELLAGSNP